MLGKKPKKPTVEENNKRPVLLQEVVYQTNGGIRFNGVLCDPRKVQWSESIHGIEKVLTIRALSEDKYPLLFECRARKDARGAFDDRNKLIMQFMQKIGVQVFRRNIVSGIYDGNPPFIETPKGLALKRGEGVLLQTDEIDLVQQTTRVVNFVGGTSYKTTKNKAGDRPKPVTENFREVVDNGTIVLTNKRLVFIGILNTLSIDLDKIENIDHYSDAMYITRQGFETKVCFSGLDGNTYFGVIAALNSM